MKIFRFLNILLVVITLVLFVACGDSSSSNTTADAKDNNPTDYNVAENEDTVSENNNNTTATKYSGTSGIAVDPYIKNATFFWDKNKNGIKDIDEPISSASDINGKFSFDVNLTSGARIVMKNKGEHNGVPYTGNLSANLSASGVVSPLTTLEVQYPNTNIIDMLSDAGIIIHESDIHKDPMNDANKNVQLTTATIAIDTFLKIDNLNEIIKNTTTLNDIIATTKELLENNISSKNIENLVKTIDRMIAQTIKDGNLDELNKMKANNTYSLNIKNTLSALSSQEASAISNLGNNGTSVTYKFALLDDKVFSFSASPILGNEVALSLNINDTSGIDIVWNVISKPLGSTLSLTPSNDKSSVSFTPTSTGMYTVEIEASTGNAKTVKNTTFNVVEIIGEGTKNISIDSDSNKLIGTIGDQSWVGSKSLNEEELTNLISKYSSLSKDGYNTTKGLLVSYTANSVSNEQLETLKLESGVDSVFNRVYHNDNAYSSNVIYPKDNGNFDDGGSNWHLEVINMPEAWEYSVGVNTHTLSQLRKLNSTFTIL